MSELNDAQKSLRDTLDGFVVVDAGPGTGKTHTLVQRYVKMIDSEIDPLNTLMITFTNNAAREMKDRISAELMKIVSQYEEKGTSDPLELKRKDRFKATMKNIKTSTFDALCLQIVLNSPDVVSEFFGTKDMLSRSAGLVENETLNTEYFLSFYARFVREKGNRYRHRGQDPAALVGERAVDVFTVIQQLMSRGVIPKQAEWFGDGEDIVNGNKAALREAIRNNSKGVNKALNEVDKERGSYNVSSWGSFAPDTKTAVPDEIIDLMVDEDRFMLTEFIRDVYYAYICESIKDNRLTFGLVELFAFAILFSDNSSRQLHSVDYMMVDEFQDTNELQMKICLLLLNHPNLCVVGDWKQGIYGFRYASVDNITQFSQRSRRFASSLRKSGVEISYEIPSPTIIEFTENYRSSELVLEAAFEALNAKGNQDEVIRLDGNVVKLKSVNNDRYKDHTHVELLKKDEKEEEIDAVVDRIIEYRRSGKYQIATDSGLREPNYGDIAVLCRTSKHCIAILERCNERNVPAYFQGDLEIMMSREGKLALAWLRYVNNPKDARGIAAILADRHYPMSEMRSMLPKTNENGETERGEFDIPREISDFRLKLIKRKRRPNDLLTSIFAFYGLNNDITQSIIDIISSAYTGSLLTISDLIRLIEEDIENSTKYSVDPSLDVKAVTIQTMHKSKGLEYPIVIVSGLNMKVMPMNKPDQSILRFTSDTGIRCTKEFVSSGEDLSHQSVINSWVYKGIHGAYPTDYSEERRILFVALSRAKQYITITASNPTQFFKHYLEYDFAKPESLDENAFHQSDLKEPPVIQKYEKRRQSLSAHDIMDTMIDPIKESEKKGKGAEYGTAVHDAAYMLAKGFKCNSDYPELKEVRRILDSLEGAKILPEVSCVLPVGDVSVKGVIDLYAEFDDRIEIHDYKTDADETYLSHYRMQVSVYAHAASAKGKPVRCFIDFLSLGKSVEVIPVPLEDIAESAKAYYRRISDMSK